MLYTACEPLFWATFLVVNHKFWLVEQKVMAISVKVPILQQIRVKMGVSGTNDHFSLVFENPQMSSDMPMESPDNSLQNGIFGIILYLSSAKIRPFQLSDNEKHQNFQQK